MSYTLRGRLESRLATVLLPLAFAAALAAVLPAWWPVELAALMVAVGLALDAAVYHPLLRYQPGWLALPLGALELAIVMLLALALDVGAPLDAAIGFYVASWLWAQILGHAAFPLLRPEYAEDGGELARAGALAAAGVASTLVLVGGVAWATRPPVVHLRGAVRGPLVLDHEQRLVGDPGAVVYGGIRVRADGVRIENVSVIGGEYGIDVEHADDVVLDRVRITGVGLDGIHVRRGSVAIRDCWVDSSNNANAQGIDIGFSFDRAPSTVKRCTLLGGREGIVTNMARVTLRDNTVTRTTLRGIAMNEMSMGEIEGNYVGGALGVGIYCGDASMCEVEENQVVGTRPDIASGNEGRAGIGILVHFHAHAELSRNVLVGNRRPTLAFAGGQIVQR
jgi:Right handed beta helix region